MKKIDCEIMVFDCPMENRNVSMEFCYVCEYHKGTSMKDGNVFHISGTIDCSYDEDTEKEEDEQ